MREKAFNRKKTTCLYFIVFLCLFGFGLFFKASRADDSIQLKYTYRPETSLVVALHDMEGKTYLPLTDVAQFYGVQVQFDPQTRRVSLSKGKNLVKLVLSQPVYMVPDPAMTFAIDPVEDISGQLGIPPQTAEDVMATLLNIDVRYIPEQQSLIVGGVSNDEIREGIRALTERTKNESAVTVTETPAVGTQTYAPTEEPTMNNPPTQAGEPQEIIGQPGKVEEEPPSDQDTYTVRRIVIDAGHGGYDSGAKGFDRRYFEKQATLDIAQRVRDLLAGKEGLEIFMTRSGDYYITLKYRTEFANRHNADLFVSIHCNSNPRTEAHGREIFVYSAKASNKEAEVAAVRENANQDFLNFTLSDLRHSKYNVLSQTLAEKIEERMQQGFGHRDRRIQKAPFYVLARVDMPSILIETAFISNHDEEQKLKDSQWKERMAQAIADGILDYKEKVEKSLENQQARR